LVIFVAAGFSKRERTETPALIFDISDECEVERHFVAAGRFSTGL
jgi:hypothetical protein